MKLRHALTALALTALSASACKDDVKPEAAKESTSATAKNGATSSDAAKSAAPLSDAKPGPSASAPAPAGSATLDAKGMPSATNGVLADGVADGILKAGGAPVVKLVSAGDEPREAITYDLGENKKQSTGMKMNLEMSMQVGAQAMPATNIPQIGMNLELSTGKKDANGDIQVDGTITKVAVKASTPAEEPLVKALQPVMDGMKGIKIDYYVSPKGRARDVKVTTPPKADPNATQMIDQMKQSFDSMVAPLPDEPVGKGASWVVVTRLKTGADILQYTTYKLKSRSGSKIELETEVKQFAASNQITAPGAGSSGKITKFLSEGTGFSALDLKSLAPEKGNGNVSGSMSLDAAPMGAMTVDTKVKIEFGPPIP
jgi:hypothetical protein